MAIREALEQQSPKLPLRRRLADFGSGLRLEWSELGHLGRVGLVGILPAAILAVSLGYSIQDLAHTDLIHSRAAILAKSVDDLPMESSPLDPGSQRHDDFESSVELRVLGGETVRVKLWTPDGTIVYSDAPLLVGQQFAIAQDLQVAFTGEPSHGPADLDGPENAYDLEFGELIEFYLPVKGPDGTVVGVFEVYEQAESLNQSLGDIRREVWWSVGIGLSVLGIFILALITAIGRALNRRRRLAENLAESVTRAREEERRRLVTSLHDDVSQPLYRVLFGLQGSRQRITDEVVAQEMEQLETLVRDVELSIRSELRKLHISPVEEFGFSPAVADLVETTREETDLLIGLEFDNRVDLDIEAESAMYRAVQESLFNIRRHAAASEVNISFATEGRRVVARVADDGVGWNGNEGIGLATTRQILRSVDGDLRIQRCHPTGTRVVIRIPVQEISV